MGGLIAGTVLTLTFLPALYALTFGLETNGPDTPALPAAQPLPELSTVER